MVTVWDGSGLFFPGHAHPLDPLASQVPISYKAQTARSDSLLFKISIRKLEKCVNDVTKFPSHSLLSFHGAGSETKSHVCVKHVLSYRAANLMAELT